MSFNDAVYKRIQEVQDKLSYYGFKKFPITFKISSLKPGVAGIANLKDDHIQISVDYLTNFYDEVISRTVAHEVVHLYVSKNYLWAKQHHGPEFRGLMAVLGVDGATKHQMHLPSDHVASSENIQRKTKTRMVYITETTKKEVLLTKAQHEKNVKYTKRYGHNCFTIKSTGEHLVFTGKVQTFK